MTAEFLKEECVENLCRILGIQPHKFLPHYVTINKFLARLGSGEPECLRKRMICALLRRRKFEDVRLLGKYWMVIFDAYRPVPLSGKSLFPLPEKSSEQRHAGKESGILPSCARGEAGP
mgnify:CR=1 FL=1